MRGIRTVRTQILRMGADLQARPVAPVQFTEQAQAFAAFGHIEDGDVLASVVIQNADGTFDESAMPGYDDPT